MDPQRLEEMAKTGLPKWAMEFPGATLATMQQFEHVALDVEDRALCGEDRQRAKLLYCEVVGFEPEYRAKFHPQLVELFGSNRLAVNTCLSD